jgi:mannose/cellobiose epimerase-like protein (N-acyl-D-glucosamine 2-epimerase family)
MTKSGHVTDPGHYFETPRLAEDLAKAADEAEALARAHERLASGGTGRGSP